MQRMLLAVLVASMSGAVTAEAQRPHTVHPPARWFINGHSVAALGTSVQPEAGGFELKTSSGIGGGVQVGYMITPRVTAYAGYEIVKQPVDVEGLGGDFGLSHLEAGAHLSLPVHNSRVLPYVGAWVGLRRLTSTIEDFDTGEEADFSMSGLAAGLSGGMQYSLSPKVALTGALSVGLGKFSKQKIDGQTDQIPTMSNSTTTRLQFGANWYP
jgi:opacity protein-like surface antigen